MARLSRIVVPDFPHHVMQRGVRSMTVFNNDDDRRRYIALLAEQCQRFRVEILAWCLMTNHVHFIATPHQETALARAFGEAHRRYTRGKNLHDNTRGYLFQGRFSSVVLDERHLLAAARYVELNPVRAAMIDLAWNYPWSSAAFHMGLRDDDPLVEDRSLLGLVTDWKEFLAGDNNRDTNSLRAATRTGRPVGDIVFFQRLAAITGKDIAPVRRGRPAKKK